MPLSYQWGKFVRNRVSGRLLAVLLLLLYAGAPTNAAEDEREVEVEVEGYAFVKGLPNAAVIERAREEARRRAIEKGGETTIERQSRVENFELVKDVILSDTKGLIKSQEWLTYPGGKEYLIKDDRLYVKLKAVVRVGKIDSDLPAIAEVLRRRGQPRILMLVKEEQGAGRESGVASAEIENIFIDKGFRVMDASAMEEVSAREREDMLDNPQRAETLLRRLQYDYLISGILRVGNEEPFNDGGLEMTRLAITARFTVVDRHLGGKVAMVQQAFHTRPIQKEGVSSMLQTALTTTGKNLGAELLSKVLDQLGRQTGVIEMIFSNAKRKKLDEVRESLRKLGGKQNFFTRSIRKGEAVVEFESQLPIDAVASYLEEQEDVALELTDQLESKLICEFE